MHKYTFFIILLTLLIMLISCAQPAEYSGENRVQVIRKTGGVAKIDLSNAALLFIKEAHVNTDPTGSEIGNTSNLRLYKVTNASINAKEEVIYRDVYNDQVQFNAIPKDIFNIDEQWIMIIYTDEINNRIAFLINKQTNDVYSLDNKHLPILHREGYINQPHIQKDGAGNIYYLSYDTDLKVYTVIKINFDEHNIPQAQVYSIIFENITYFFISDDGDIMYQYYLGTTLKTAIITHKKTIIDFDIPLMGLWKNSEGAITYYNGRLGTKLDMGSFYYFFQDFIITRFNTNLLDIDDTHITEIENVDYSSILFYPYDAYYFGFNKYSRGFFIVPEFDNAYIIDIESPQQLSFTIDDIIFAAQSDNNLYLFGKQSDQKVLLKINPVTYEEVEFTINNDYDIKKLVGTPDDYLFFTAIDTTNSNIIIGKITPDGITEVIEEVPPGEIISIISLN